MGYGSQGSQFFSRVSLFFAPDLYTGYLHVPSVYLLCLNAQVQYCKHKYMLFAGWEVRIVKNCDLGLENAPRGRRPRVAFSSPRSQFFTIRTDLKPANNSFFFPPISNGNRTEWSPIRSVIIRVITKSQLESDLFVTSMNTDRIRRHEVLLPINHKNYNF